MTLIEFACSITISLVIVFGVVSIALLESTVNDMKMLENRLDRLETDLYIFDKFFHEYLGVSHGQQTED